MREGGGGTSRGGSEAKVSTGGSSGVGSGGGGVRPGGGGMLLGSLVTGLEEQEATGAGAGQLNSASSGLVSGKGCVGGGGVSSR